MKILVLSPHRGDAAFSIAVSMGNWLAAGHVGDDSQCLQPKLVCALF